MTQASTTTVNVEHVTLPCVGSFAAVRARLEAEVPTLDLGILTLLRFNAIAHGLAELEKLPPLSIFGSRDHGALLAIAGRRGEAIQYDIGNPLTASLMTRHVISASLYAPMRVLLRSDGRSNVAFEYDRATSTFGQFGDREVMAVASGLDEALVAALRSAARG